MDNIFKNANLTVESNSFTIKSSNPLNMVSESALANEKLRELNQEEKNNKLQEKIDNIEEEAKKQDIAEKIVEATLAEAQLPNKMNMISVEGKDVILKDILFELFYKSLVMDEYFLEENANTLKSLTDTYVDDNGGFGLLESAISTTNSNLLKKIKSICESTANTVCKRKLEQYHQCKDPSCLEFDINDEEKAKLEYDKDTIDIEKISELVKNKVLTVIQDEKNREEEESKIVAEIEEDLIENEDVKDEKSLNEALDRIVIGKSPINEATLFNALLKNSYKESLLENVAIQTTDHKNIQDDKDFSETYDPNASINDVVNGDIEKDTDISEDEINENIAIENKSSVDMDMVLVEAITKYTLMEMLYTLKLENYTYDNIVKLTRKLVN